MSFIRRTIDIRTRLVHAAELEKSGHYDYIERTACGINASHSPIEFFSKPPQTEVTCLMCIAMEGDDG